MSKIVKIAMFLVALTATFSFGSYGFRAGFSLYDYSSGISETDKYVKMGYGFGGGLVTITSLTSKLSFVSELSFLYRRPVILRANEDGHTEEMYVTEFAMSIPIMFQLALAEGIPYLAAGVQLDSPISPKATMTSDGEEKTTDANGRESLDFGIVFGVGYLITSNIGVDARAVISLTSPFKNADDSSLNQYGAGLTYYF
jgi:hypothetical protein